MNLDEMIKEAGKHGLRRWLLVDEWTSECASERTYRIIGRFWTESGARLRHAWLAALLRGRGGHASVLLYDQKTEKVSKLSTQ